jgi:hypothetical protein
VVVQDLELDLEPLEATEAAVDLVRTQLEREMVVGLEQNVA